MSCGQIALRELGIIPATYYASEIDKHAIRQTQLNFPDTVHLGDVTRWREWNIDWAGIDLLLAGSPCQGFSFAGKQLAFDDPRSALFFVFIDILNHCRKFNPDVLFLLENVNMKREHMKVINGYCGLFPVNINSALVSAQNRDRWYWTNIRTQREGLFGELHTAIPQPEDRGILLKDILEYEVDEKYYLSDKCVETLLRHAERQKEAGTGFAKKFHKEDEKMSALKVGGQGADDLVVERCAGVVVTERGLRPYSDGKTYCLDTGQTNAVPIGCKVRRLTPTELSRCQTIPEWYQWNCSDTQVRKMCGNGWTVEVIKHILSFLPDIEKYKHSQYERNSNSLPAPTKATPLIEDVVRYVSNLNATGSLFDDDTATSCMSFYGLCK